MASLGWIHQQFGDGMTMTRLMIDGNVVVTMRWDRR
jgi:hypothetical protein